MQGIKKYCSLLIAFLLAIGVQTISFASTTGIKTQTDSNGTVEIEFNFGEVFAGEEFGYEIIFPGAELTGIDNSNKETILDTFAQIGQATADADGKATIVFKPKAMSGIYSINAGRKTNKLKTDFLYFSEQEVKNLALALSTIAKTDKDAVKALFNQAEEDKFAGYELLALDTTDAYEIFSNNRNFSSNAKEDVYAYMANDAFLLAGEGTLDEVQSSAKNLFEKSVYKSQFVNTNDKKVVEKLIKEETENLGIKDSVIYKEIYLDGDLCNSKAKTKAHEMLAKNTWEQDEKDNIAKTIEDIVFAATISENSVYGKIGEIIETAEEALKENGVDWEAFDKYSGKQAIYREIAGMERNDAGVKFNSLSDFAKYLSEEIGKEAEEEDKSDKKTQGGGGGSSKSVSLGGNVAAVSPLKEVNGIDLFNDLENVVWAKDAISYLVENKILNGRSENSFAPNDNMKREELAKMLVLAFQSSGKERTEFKDSDKNAWYYDYVSKAASSGLMMGYGDVFGIGDSVTREDLATICYRVLQSAKVKIDVNDIEFTDNAEISEYAKDAVKALASAGIINGMDEGRFNPKLPATRAQAAKIIYQTIVLKEGE